MRDWNKPLPHSSKVVYDSIHRFYEGLKLHELGYNKIIADSIHRFYEGLKPTIVSIWHTFTKQYSSFLWGIETMSTLFFIPFILYVFIVSMRDWNVVGFYKCILLSFVFIVSMRDWNYIDCLYNLILIKVFIVSMRDWNLIYVYR